MSKSKQSATSEAREQAWRNHILRHASSGQTISAYCRDNAISEGNFYAWRTKLRDPEVGLAAPTPVLPATPFIDLGVVKPTTQIHTPPIEQSRSSTSNLEIRINIGDGLVLTIARH